MNDLLVTMHGPDALDVRKMSNFEAGIAALVAFDKLFPGIRWDQLGNMRAPVTMRGGCDGFWDCAGSFVSDATDYIGRHASDIIDKTGEVGGKLVRLATDGKVIDGASRLGTAYATGGGSEGVRGILQSLGMSQGGQDNVIGFISQLGEMFKGSDATGPQQAGVAGLPGGVLPWALAGGLLLAMVFGRRA